MPAHLQLRLVILLLLLQLQFVSLLLQNCLLFLLELVLELLTSRDVGCVVRRQHGIGRCQLV